MGYGSCSLTNSTLRDTVSSIGVFRGKTLPGTTEGMKHVKFFRHALALDERRVKFLPEYAYEGSSLPDDKQQQDRELKNRFQSADDPPHTKEVWFSGTHSDMSVLSLLVQLVLDVYLTRMVSAYLAEEEMWPTQIWTKVNLPCGGCRTRPPLQDFAWRLSRVNGI